MPDSVVACKQRKAPAVALGFWLFFELKSCTKFLTVALIFIYLPRKISRAFTPVLVLKCQGPHAFLCCFICYLSATCHLVASIAAISVHSLTNECYLPPVLLCVFVFRSLRRCCLCLRIALKRIIRLFLGVFLLFIALRSGCMLKRN